MKSRNDEGDGKGLNILLSVVTILFIIGLVIFIFSLMGGAFGDTTAVTQNNAVVNETLTFTNETETSVANLNQVQLNDVVLFGCYSP